LTIEPRIVVVDYGLGNLHSVEKALNYLGIKALVSDGPDAIAQADGVILPGVGAFGDGIKRLTQQGFVPALRDYAGKGKPLLGICLGMQLLFSQSDEFGCHEGLNLIQGKVEYLLPQSVADEMKCRIPHIGWNRLVLPNWRTDWKETILAGLKAGDEFYFIHSYHCVPADQSIVLATTNYGGNDITAVVKKGLIYGCQFHPEKSREVGLKILKTFSESAALFKQKLVKP
jgi:glutamine amidotransferase